MYINIIKWLIFQYNTKLKKVHDYDRNKSCSLIFKTYVCNGFTNPNNIEGCQNTLLNISPSTLYVAESVKMNKLMIDEMVKYQPI